jgi:hypothetical protein
MPWISSPTGTSQKSCAMASDALAASTAAPPTLERRALTIGPERPRIIRET